MTLRQYTALVQRWHEAQARQDRRTQQIVWILAEINRDREKRPEPYAIEDFNLHQWSLAQRAAPSEPPSAEAIAWEEIHGLQAGVAAFFGPAAAVIHSGTSA